MRGLTAAATATSDACPSFVRRLQPQRRAPAEPPPLPAAAAGTAPHLGTSAWGGSRVAAPVRRAVGLERQKTRVANPLKLRGLCELPKILGELHLPSSLFLFNQERHLPGLT